jgi:hypothetical protein
MHLATFSKKYSFNHFPSVSVISNCRNAMNCPLHVYIRPSLACSTALTPDMAMSLKIDKEHTSVTKSEHQISPKPLLTSWFADVTAEKVFRYPIQHCHSCIFYTFLRISKLKSM